MTDRYEIKELVEQDETGVIYRVRDRESGGMAVLRRFFPLDSPGSGFVEEEAAAYGGTVRALRKLHHDSLCAVLGGGVDRVDGVPYLLTELPEGESLEEMLKRGSLSPEEAVAVAGQGLELLGLIGEIFGGEEEWLEMEASAVVVNAESGLCRFAICPLQVLGVAKRDGGVRGLGYLVERLMGWTGQLVPQGAAAGLGGWVAKAKAGKWAVNEAFAELVRIRRVWTGEEVPTPAAVQAIVSANATAAVQSVIAAPTRVNSAPEKGGSARWAAVICFGLFFLGGGIWALIKQPWLNPVAIATNEGGGSSAAGKPGAKPGLTDQERVDRNVKEASNAVADSGESRSPRQIKQDPPEPKPTIVEDPSDSDPVPVSDPDPEPEDDHVMPAVFTPEDGKVMRRWLKFTVVLEGTMLRVRDSRSGKTRYMEFADSGDKNAISVRCWPGTAGLEIEDLEEFVGKKVRVTGVATREAATGRSMVDIRQKKHIEVLD